MSNRHQVLWLLAAAALLLVTGWLQPAVAGAAAPAAASVSNGSSVENRLTGLTLTTGQALILHYLHNSEGQLTCSIDLESVEPGLCLQVKLLLQPPGDDQPVELYSAVQTEASAAWTVEAAAAGDLLLVLTPQPPTGGEMATSTLLLSVALSGDLQPDVSLPPTLALAQPANGSEYWGEQERVEFAVQATPFYPVYFGQSEQPIVTDASGIARQPMQLEASLVNTLQAFSIGPSGHMASVTAAVVHHWVSSNPAKPLVLSRQDTINVRVPQAELVDLALSNMTVDGQPVRLTADLANNLLYGWPGQLTSGTHQVQLALFSQSEEGVASRWLDSLSWQLVIPGERQAELWPGRNVALVNGVELPLDAGPYLDAASGSNMIPIRFLGDLLGATVDWNASDHSVTFRLGNRAVQLFTGSLTAYVDGVPLQLTVAPASVNSRTMVPLRFVIENLGADVRWDNQAKQISVHVPME